MLWWGFILQGCGSHTGKEVGAPGPVASAVSWELLTNTNSWTYHKPTESETQGQTAQSVFYAVILNHTKFLFC